MATFISLCSFTDQGIRSVDETIARADAVKSLADKFGCSIQVYWTQGAYDLVSVIEAPDESSAAAFGLTIARSGNVRLQTLRAFDHDEMQGILAKLR